jgi:hypothetical protein
MSREPQFCRYESERRDDSLAGQGFPVPWHFIQNVRSGEFLSQRCRETSGQFLERTQSRRARNEPTAICNALTLSPNEPNHIDERNPMVSFDGATDLSIMLDWGREESSS